MSYQSQLVDPLPLAHRVCAICGNGGLDVRPMLARLRDPGPSGPFTHMTRCKDVSSCRQRCEANGDPWPLADRAEELAHR